MAEKEELKKIKDIVELMIANDLVEVEIVEGDNKVHIKRPNHTAVAMMPQQMYSQMPVMQAAPASASAPQATAEDTGLIDVKSPIVGTFYAAPSPDAEPYIKVGSDVNTETVVCIIEAMKVMNEIKAETTGTIAKIMVANGQAVEYGQLLFKVRPH
jgi:acetyl-CoA carboxylase biotin carboxyl carrier protein